MCIIKKEESTDVLTHIIPPVCIIMVVFHFIYMFMGTSYVVRPKMVQIVLIYYLRYDVIVENAYTKLPNNSKKLPTEF